MHSVELPLILSPSLGCPQIISLGTREPISVMIASKDGRFGAWSLSPSSSNLTNSLNRISLFQKDVLEIPQLSGLAISSLNDTQTIFSKELLMEVLGSEARIFKVNLLLSDSEPFRVLRKMGDNFRPTLYDLNMEDTVIRCKQHAVCITECKDKDFRFIHVTDLHLARRNDLIEEEISSAAGRITGFNNFNEKMRIFIREANARADKGELDLVLIGGDLVDFVNHGVSDEALEADNNWQLFIDIATGCGRENEKGNYGLKVPIFTSTGNHDWRLHPYDIINAASAFGVDKAQANNFDFEYYDTIKKLNAKKDSVYEKIIKKGSLITKENLFHTAAKKFLGYSETWQAKTLVPIISALFTNFSASVKTSSLWPIFVSIIALGIHYAINSIIAKHIRYLVTNAIIPIEGGVHALHYYLLHINPYFNYAFSYGSHNFIIMDTGPDCFIGQYLWDEGNKKMVRMCIKDNLLGGSPDSMAFYPVNEYYTCGQISWLEQILKVIESENRAAKRIYICLHASPINVEHVPSIPFHINEVLLRKGEIDIRHGTINHFLSQFFHLCLGKKENTPEYSGPKVDIVFSGHAHQKIEFRLEPGPLIYTGKYSDKYSGNFDAKKPFIVQTAACGPLNTGYDNPPYFRTIHVDKNGVILSFS